MFAITYKNTITTLRGAYANTHIDQPIGYAYENDTHFIHFYGGDQNMNVISLKSTVSEGKAGDLEDWVKKVFGAVEIQRMALEVGYSVEGVWRPGLYYQEDIFQALNIGELEMRIVEQSLRILIEKLDDIFLYIEPNESSLKTYSHKTRELLILACTEVENLWNYYMYKTGISPINKYNYTTKDYVRLMHKLNLGEFECSFIGYSNIPPILPFTNWNASSPSASLDWYEAYNKTKHDKYRYFFEATLFNCIKAVVANLVMYCVRFSPFPLFEGLTTFSSLMNQHFKMTLNKPNRTSFYLPELRLPCRMDTNLNVFQSREAGFALPFNVLPLVL